MKPVRHSLGRAGPVALTVEAASLGDDCKRNSYPNRAWTYHDRDLITDKVLTLLAKLSDKLDHLESIVEA
jgi:hypothetical protein